MVSANELLRFPLDEVLVLAEGQYPIRARHIRYYEDRHFAPIERARAGRALSKVQKLGSHEPSAEAVKLSGLAATREVTDAAEKLPAATAVFREIAHAAKGKRRLPARV